MICSTTMLKNCICQLKKKNKTSYKKYTLIALPVIAFLGALFYLNKTKNDKNQKAKKVKNF